MQCHVCSFSNSGINFKHWELGVNVNQHYLGRCVLRLKRHCPSLSQLTSEEWKEFEELVPKIESSLKKSFDCVLVNWSCSMNRGFKRKPYYSHVHWHVIPRYDKQVNFVRTFYKDSEFGNVADFSKERLVSEDLRVEIEKTISDNLV